MASRLPDDDEILALASADDVAAAVRRVFAGPLEGRGVVHSLDVWQGDRGRLVGLRARPDAPGSRHGTFARGVARARADAVVTTAAVLRAMPDLDHRLPGSGGMPAALAEWRRERLAKRQPPVTLVVAARGDVDLEHPVFRHWTRPLVYASRQAQWQLESRAVDQGVEVVGADEPTVAGAVEFLRRAFGAATLALEVPPPEAGGLYGPPAAVDEVLLATWRALEAPAEMLGDPYLTAEDLTRRFSRRSRPHRVAAANGEWSFQRFRR